MIINRSDFLKKVCFSGACMCGFGWLSGSALKEKDTDPSLMQEWISSLLLHVNLELDIVSAKKVIKKTAEVHYKNLNMDSLLADYKDNLDKFIVFLQNQWGWKIDYNKEKRTLIADENKNHCVCPIAIHNKERDSSSICYCSEGFAEKMFSFVSGMQANAEVIDSVRRGDESCKYKIVFS
jgi:hypothetical protein